MTTPLGTNVVTSIVNRFLMPEIVDNIYNSNPVWFRLNRANKKLVRGGNHIEVPLMTSRFTNGGPYQGLDVLDVSPNDTVRTAAWSWKQHYVPVSFDGLTLLKTDSPDAIANIIQFTMDQAEMEMAENLATGLWGDGTGTLTSVKDIDGLAAAVDDATNVSTYGGLSRSTAPYSTIWKSFYDGSNATLTLNVLQAAFGTTQVGGRAPTLIVSRQDQYNRFWNLNQVMQTMPTQPGGRDEVLAQAGFHNQLFNGVPWVVDSHVPLGSGSNSRIYMLNEDFIYWVVNPRADFYMEPFQTPIQQDALAAKLLWAGNLVVTNCKRQGVLASITA